MAGSARQYIRQISWPIVVAMIALMIIGVLAIRVCERADPSIAGKADKQMNFGAAALAGFCIMLAIPYAHVGRVAYVGFAVVMAMLIGVLFVADARGAHRWYDLGVIKFQPSELAKLSYIVMMGWYLRRGDNYRKLTGLVAPAVLTLAPMGLILIEPDLGTALLFAPVLFFMLFLAGARGKHFAWVMVLIAAAVFLPLPRRADPAWSADQLADRKALAYFSTDKFIISPAPLAVMRSHQLRRVSGWLRQGAGEVQIDEGYQLAQAKMMLGSGCAAGRSGWNDADAYFRPLPDDHTDFIYAVIGGQWGFVGAGGVLAIYAVIFLFGVGIAVGTYDAFGRMLAVGVLALLLSQILINIGMTLGLMPITGMTLPMISYGGSSLVVNCAAMGLLVNVGMRRPILLGRRPFEHKGN